MDFLPLIGKQLKDDDVIEVLDDLEIEVVYDFDRLHENQPDIYWATSSANGFQFRFNESQVLKVIFLYLTPRDGFTALSSGDCDVPLFATAAEVRGFGATEGLPITEGKVDFLEVARHWVRLQYTTYSIHYEFSEGRLNLVTISQSETS